MLPLALATWLIRKTGNLNLSNEQITQELDLASKDVQTMTSQLCAGIMVKKPVELSGEI
jgi:hypothetical protein